MAVKFNPFTGNLDLIDTTAAAGSNTQIQFNSAGLLDGSADLTWDDTGKVLGVGGDVNLDDGGSFTTTLQTITPTANRTISFPDATGTVALVAGSSGQLIYNSAGANAGASTLTYDGSILTSTGRFINSYNATASSPAKAFTGTWFTGGTATTTKPQVLIEPTGTTSTAWSTSGTGLGVNAASGFAGNLLDLQVNGTSQVKVSSSGEATVASLISNTIIRHASSIYQLNHTGSVETRGLILSSTSGVNWTDLFILRDAADTLAQRRGTNAQTYRLYNSYTDASNYQRTSITDDSTGLVIDQQYAGTGAARTNLLELKDNGTSVATITNVGAGTFSNVVTGYNFYAKGGTANNLAALFGTNNGRLVVASAGLVGFTNSATSVTATVDTALKRDQAGVIALTDGSTGTGYLKQTPVAVSALPAAATVGAGTRGFVSDSTVAASGNFGATVTGGGSNNVPVFSDGTNWLIG